MHPDDDALMIALRKSDVADLNQRARERLHATGQLGDTELEADGKRFAVGDRVIAGHNDRRLGIASGDRAHVTEIDAERRTLTIERGGEPVELTASYLDAGHLDHAYAITAHRAQGATVDRTFVLGSDELYREWGYTALTRHREAARFYVNLPLEQETLPGLRAQDLDREVERALARSRGKTLALDICESRDPGELLNALLGHERSTTAAEEIGQPAGLDDVGFELDP